MVGNPNHGKDGKFSSGLGGADTGSGHNAGKGNRVVAEHIKDQHYETQGLHTVAGPNNTHKIHNVHGDTGLSSYGSKSAANRAIKTGAANRYLASKGRGLNMPHKYPNRKSDWKG